MEGLLVSSQKVTLNLGSLQVCRTEQKHRMADASEYAGKQSPPWEAAGLVRRKPRVETRPPGDGKSAGVLGGFHKAFGLLSGISVSVGDSGHRRLAEPVKE